jgi:RHS repeat-associated protein
MTDATGAVRARYEYDPYGRATKLSGDKDAVFGFTGHYVHGSTGLNFAIHRAYDASLGRWVSEDPIGLRGRDLNLYGYVGNSPINAVDPTGEFAIPIAVVAVVTLAVLTGMLVIHTIQHPPPVPPWPTPIDPPPMPPPRPPNPGPDRKPPTTSPSPVPIVPPVWPQPPQEQCKPDNEEDPCEEEWREAYETCRDLLSKPNPPRGVTGGYKNIQDCARGLVSEECGGNPVSY